MKHLTVFIIALALSGCSKPAVESQYELEQGLVSAENSGVSEVSLSEALNKDMRDACLVAGANLKRNILGIRRYRLRDSRSAYNTLLIRTHDSVSEEIYTHPKMGNVVVDIDRYGCFKNPYVTFRRFDDSEKDSYFIIRLSEQK